MVDFSQYSWLIPALPITASALIAAGYLYGSNRGEKGEGITGGLAIWFSTLSLLLLLAIDIQAILNGAAPGQVQYTSWINSGDFTVLLSFTLDILGLSIATLFAFLCVLVIRFSRNYIHREVAFHRFHIILLLFMSAMLLIVMAGNVALVFVGWELAGVSSYLLIAYAHTRPVAAENATRAFITNRIGDAGFLMGIALSFFWLQGIEWPVIARNAPGLDVLHAGIIAAAFLIAAMAKSGQVPFSPWISRSLEGPTPSSAIFYGSLMVHVGVYLVIRMQPVFEQAPEMMMALIVIGLLTAVYGFLCGLVQADTKSILMFSTLSHVGLMFVASGLGYFEAATWYMLAHASWRAYQFLSAPSVIQLMEHPTRPVPHWLRKLRWLYTASLQRFWLDNAAQGLIVRPTQSLARDTNGFDERVVNRIAGLPDTAGAVSSIGQWEARKYQSDTHVINNSNNVGKGKGAMGKLMELVASLMHWFEDHLVLKGTDEGLLKVIHRIGNYLIDVDEILSKPRYLLTIIIITFVVII